MTYMAKRTISEKTVVIPNAAQLKLYQKLIEASCDSPLYIFSLK